MTAEYLKEIFESTYNQQQWTSVLREVFGIKNVLLKPQAVDTSSNKWDAKGFELGNFETLEGRLVGVYEVQISDSVKLERNKVGLRNLLKPIYDNDVDAALIVFNQGRQWRFSYVSQVRVRNKETNRREKRTTDPKRYTYLFGNGQKCRTAAERFAKIQQHYNLFGGAVKLEEIEKAFSVDSLTKDFYRELSDWYFRALKEVKFPDDAERAVNPKPKKEELEKEEKNRNATNTIRLITRLIFVWFLKQKGLVPDELFDKAEIDKIINYKDKTGSTYYKAILQNLFFATLNTEMGDENRKFIVRQYGIQTYYRYKRFFKNTDRFLELTKNIPFLNGGLFENLDKNIEDTDEDSKIRIDCFSNALKNEERLTVPDSLFFDEETVDLSADYGDKKKKSQKVRGLVNILQSYNFTIEENTPFEIEIALDPELLGKVFENLLASYNPETETTARKMTGSFYTPREIVDYMVDESLKAYLASHLTEQPEEKLNRLFSYNTDMAELDAAEKEKLIHALDEAKILDPACGSGAFPMGVLHKMVWLLTKLDPDNTNWREIQRKKAIEETEEAFKLGNKEDRDERLRNISEAFEDNSDDYGRKLYLIENCIYGVDIQPIAVQIAKLRFFISLICDQEINENKKNRGVRPLPNLETKFVAANTLIGLNKPKQLLLRNPKIEDLEAELSEVRHKHFSARTSATKRKWRTRDHELREQIGELLKYDGWDNSTAEQIANWNPYDQNTSADFFDNEWMFGIIEGFSIVISNPPYVRVQALDDNSKLYYSKNYKSATGNYDLYVIFTERGLMLTSSNGILSFIEPNKFFVSTYGKGIRKLISDNSHMYQIIDFKANQVFETATTYTCIVFLKKYPSKEFKYFGFQDNVKFKDVEEFLATPNKEFIFFNAKDFDSTSWIFSNESESEILRIIREVGEPLENFTTNISQGLKTGADKIFIDYFDKWFENAGLIKVLKGDEIQRYRIEYSGRKAIFPYKKYKNAYIPMDEEEFKNLINSYTHLLINKTELKKRDGGKIKSNEWFLYSRNQFINLVHESKIITRDISQKPSFAIDTKGEFGLMGGYGLTFKRNINVKYILGVLNSNICYYQIRKISVLFRGLYYSYEARFIKQLIIALPAKEVQSLIVKIVNILMYNPSLNFFNDLLNSIVYEIYLNEKVRNAGCEIIKHLQNFPDITECKNNAEISDVIEKEFNVLSQQNHPVRVAMFNMDTIEEISIIEGKKK